MMHIRNSKYENYKAACSEQVVAVFLNTSINVLSLMATIHIHTRVCIYLKNWECKTQASFNNKKKDVQIFLNQHKWKSEETILPL